MKPPRPSRAPGSKAGSVSPPRPRGTALASAAVDAMDALPPNFRCASSGRVLQDPVKACDGNVYEREVIEDWFRKGHSKSPVTGLELENFVLMPHKALQAAVVAYMAACKELNDSLPEPKLDGRGAAGCVAQEVDPGSQEELSGALPEPKLGDRGAAGSVAQEVEPGSQEEQTQDDEIQDLCEGLRSQMSLAFSDLASDAPAAARLKDELEFSKKVVLQATGGRVETVAVQPNGEDHSPTGNADSVCDQGEVLPTTPVSARLAQPAGVGEVPAIESGPLREMPGSRGRRSGFADNGHSRSDQSPPGSDLRQVGPLSRSRRRLAPSRSPSPEEGDPSFGLDKTRPRQASASNLRSPLGHTRATPRRPGLMGSSAAGGERSGAASARSLGTRARPRSPASGSTAPGSVSQAAAGRAARLSITAASSSSGAQAARGPAAAPRGQRGTLGIGSAAPSACRSRVAGPSVVQPADGFAHPSSTSSRRSSACSSGSGVPPYAPTPPVPPPRGPGRPGLAPAASTAVVRRHRRQDEATEGLPATPPLSSVAEGSSAQAPAAQQAKEIDDAGRTPLMHAAREGNIGRTRQLLSTGASVDATDACRCTALMYSATYGHLDVARCLVEHAADVDAKSQDRWTPLIAAAYNGKLQMAQFLLSKGARIEAADERGWTSLMHVAFNGNSETLRCLLDHRAKVDEEDSEGRTALVYAAFNGHLENVRCLLARSDKVARRLGPEQGEGPPGLALLFAASHGHVEVVRCLLEVSRASAENQQGALKLASSNGHHAVVELLCRRPGAV